MQNTGGLGRVPSIEHQAPQRHDHQNVTDAHREAYSTQHKERLNAIRDAQVKSWAELCKAIEDDSWGLPSKLAVGRTLSPTTSSQILRQPTGH